MIFGRRRQEAAPVEAGRDIYMLIHQIGRQAGGMTISMMSRANLFVKNGWRAALVTTDEKADYRLVEAEYHRLGILDRRARLINVFDHYRERAGTGEGGCPEYTSLVRRDEPGMFCAATKGSGDRELRYFDAADGRYRMFKQFRADGSLEFVDWFNDAHTRTKRVEFTAQSEPRRELTYDPYGSIVIQDRFFAADGFCFLMRWHGVKTRAVYKVLHFARGGRVIAEYDSSLAFEKVFLESLAKDSAPRPVFIGDGVGGIVKLPSVTANGAMRYMQIHSNHHKSPLLGTDEILEDHDKVFVNARKIDGVIILTDRQRDDVVARYGNEDITHVIPHAFPAVPVANEKREKLSAVSMGRLSPEKAYDIGIGGFRKVVDELPDAVYRIYGTGPEQASLQALIDELELGENVFLMGFTREVDRMLARAQVSVMTSVYEGLPLSVAEACLQETPVIAFDIRYGPAAFIQGPGHGSLLPTRDEGELAREIVRYLRDPKMTREVGARARASVVDRFGEQPVFRRWMELIG